MERTSPRPHPPAGAKHRGVGAATAVKHPDSRKVRIPNGNNPEESNPPRQNPQQNPTAIVRNRSKSATQSKAASRNIARPAAQQNPQNAKTSLHTTGSGRVDLHGLESVGHEIVIEIRGEELRNGRILRNPSHAGIPSVKRHQRHHAIDENEYETDQRQRIANLPRNALDQSQQSRQNQLDPNQAEDTPEEHVFAGRTPVNRKPLPRVIPCANAERGLHEPAGEIFERATDHRA